jgi:hypothetical protein
MTLLRTFCDGKPRHVVLAIGAVLVPLATACADTDPPLDLATCDEPETYRIARVELPLSGIAAQAMGRDFNGDGTPDNNLGKVAGVLVTLFGDAIDLEGHARAHLEADVDWRIVLRGCADQRTAIALTAGDAEPIDYLVSNSGDKLARGAGAELPLAALFDGLGELPDPGWLPAATAIVEVPARSADELTIDLAVAVDHAVAFEIVVDVITPFLDLHMVDYRDALDANGDGQLTRDEVAAAPVVQSLITADLDLTTSNPKLSYGLRAHATRLP